MFEPYECKECVKLDIKRSNFCIDQFSYRIRRSTFADFPVFDAQHSLNTVWHFTKTATLMFKQVFYFILWAYRYVLGHRCSIKWIHVTTLQHNINGNAKLV